MWSIFLSRTAFEIYFAIAIALAVAWFKHSYDEGRRDEGRAEYAVIQKTCEDVVKQKKPADCARDIGISARNLQAALDANANLSKQVGDAQQSVDKLRGELADADKATAEAKAAAQAARTRLANQQQQDAAILAQYRATIARAPSVENCDGICARANAVLRSAIDDARLRDAASNP